ncbi:NAD(P)/FAD-dependent oxidoreductase [Pseudonocardia xishanensis]|uniref:NAD(P)/FAD-dependent oxidoreductase n=1 Tax=Pseudonocardia xishanensis TaxID=630995 RepID=A0ABP8RW51_9PSEU
MSTTPHGPHPDMTDDADDDGQALRAALAVANLPTLLLVLRDLTGDASWLVDHAPSRTIAMNDNDEGGFDAAEQQAIRDAAFTVLREIRNGTRKPAPTPADTDLVDALSRSLGEPVPAEYAVSMAEDAGFAPHPAFDGPELERDLRVLVIGAGVSGLCIGAALRSLGADFTIVERHDDVGGTWLANDYPGAGVDTPSHLYSFSFAPRGEWSRYYPRQDEILGYLRDVAKDQELLPHIRFGREVVSAEWREASADWLVRIADGTGAVSEEVADAVVSSVGQLTTPMVPDIPGLADFAGPVFHTAEWDHSVLLAGKRVGVVGAGASAMQVVPSIAEEAGETLVFQRSPQWVSPNANYLREIDPRIRYLMQHVPHYREWYRLRLLWQFQDKLHPTLQRDPDWPHPERSLNAVNDKHRAFFTEYIKEQLAGHEDLIEKVLPDYPPYGKRMLLDYDWYRTLKRPDVTLITSGVKAVEGSTIVTDDGRYDVDVLILATGFTARRMLHPLDLRGRSGVPLSEQWGDDDAWAYLGVTVPDFPNLFLMYGPNTNLGHGGSTMFSAECQATHVVGVLRELAARGARAAEVTDEASADYVARVDEAHGKMVWTHPGMGIWYRNAAGRVVTNSPWRLVDYWAMTREVDPAAYRWTGAAT